LKSFIYCFILLDFYNLINYSIDGYKEFVNEDNNYYFIENINRSLENYWNWFFNLFIILMNKHIKLINNKKYNIDFKKLEEINKLKKLKEKIDYNSSLPDAEYKLINDDFNLLYIFKEKILIIIINIKTSQVLIMCYLKII